MNWQDSRIDVIARLYTQLYHVKKSLYKMMPMTDRYHGHNKKSIERGLLTEKFRIERELKAQECHLTSKQITKAHKISAKQISIQNKSNNTTKIKKTSLSSSSSSSNEDIWKKVLPSPYAIQLMHESKLTHMSNGVSHNVDINQLYDVMDRVDRKSMNNAIAGSTLYNPLYAELEIKTKGISLIALSNLRSIPVKLHDLPESCCICIEIMKMNEYVTELPCKHIYHSACLKKWLERSKVCPLCKGEALSNTSTTTSNQSNIKMNIHSPYSSSIRNTSTQQQTTTIRHHPIIHRERRLPTIHSARGSQRATKKAQKSLNNMQLYINGRKSKSGKSRIE